MRKKRTRAAREKGEAIVERTESRGRTVINFLITGQKNVRFPDPLSAQLYAFVIKPCAVWPSIISVCLATLGSRRKKKQLSIGARAAGWIKVYERDYWKNAATTYDLWTWLRFLDVSIYATVAAVDRQLSSTCVLAAHNICR